MTAQLPDHEFIADRDMIDSLKLESSMLSPEQDKNIQMFVKQIIKTFILLFEPFIPKKTIENSEDIGVRTLIMDTDQFKEMCSDWDTIELVPAYPKEGTIGAFFVQGSIMAFDNPNKIWDIFTEEFQKLSILRFGSEKAAKKTLVGIGISDMITHEVVHHFQDHRLPEAFLECATRYYQRKINEQIGNGYLKEELEEERINYFSQLVNKYGDSVHKLFFGSEIDPQIKNEILRDFDLEKDKLFPEGLGLK